MIIITPDHDENESEALTENVKGLIENSGTVLDTDVWGKETARLSQFRSAVKVIT